MPTTDPATVECVNEEIKSACRDIFGDGFADHAVDLWEGTPRSTDLIDAAGKLLAASVLIVERELIEKATGYAMNDSERRKEEAE